MNTYDPAKKKVVKIGSVIGGILYKNVRPEHFMRIVDGYGIQYEAFNEMAGQVQKIVINEANGNRWIATYKDWKLHSKTGDYGNGKQVFLSLKFMKKYNPPPNLDNVPSTTDAIVKALDNPVNKRKWDDLGKKLH